MSRRRKRRKTKRAASPIPTDPLGAFRYAIVQVIPWDRTYVPLSYRKSSDAKINFLLSATPGVKNWLAMTRSRFSILLRRVPIRHLREVFNRFSGETEWPDQYSKEALIQSLIARFRGGSLGLPSRAEEESILNDPTATPSTTQEVDASYTFVFVSLCGHSVPKDVAVHILSFMTYDYSLLTSVGLVSYDWYVTVLSSWPSVRITCENMFEISSLVMRSVSSVEIFLSRMRFREWEYVLQILRGGKQKGCRVRKLRLQLGSIWNWNRFVDALASEKSESGDVLFESVEHLSILDPEKFGGAELGFVGSSWQFHEFLPKIETIHGLPVVFLLTLDHLDLRELSVVGDELDVRDTVMGENDETMSRKSIGLPELPGFIRSFSFRKSRDNLRGGFSLWGQDSLVEIDLGLLCGPGGSPIAEKFEELALVSSLECDNARRGWGITGFSLTVRQIELCSSLKVLHLGSVEITTSLLDVIQSLNALEEMRFDDFLASCLPKQSHGWDPVTFEISPVDLALIRRIVDLAQAYRKCVLGFGPFSVRIAPRARVSCEMVARHHDPLNSLGGAYQAFLSAMGHALPTISADGTVGRICVEAKMIPSPRAPAQFVDGAVVWPDPEPDRPLDSYFRVTPVLEALRSDRRFQTLIENDGAFFRAEDGERFQCVVFQINKTCGSE